jgi:hypothetical protein
MVSISDGWMYFKTNYWSSYHVCHTHVRKVLSLLVCEDYLGMVDYCNARLLTCIDDRILYLYSDAFYHGACCRHHLLRSSAQNTNDSEKTLQMTLKHQAHKVT